MKITTKFEKCRDFSFKSKIIELSIDELIELLTSLVGLKNGLGDYLLLKAKEAVEQGYQGLIIKSDPDNELYNVNFYVNE